MFKWLTKVYKKNCKYTCEHIEALAGACRKLERANDSLILHMNLIKKVLDSGERIVCLTIHREQYVIVTVYEQYDYRGLNNIEHRAYTLNLLGSRIEKVQNLFSEIYYDTQYNIPKTAKIVDFYGNVINKGYGSIVMTEYLNYMKKLKIQKITGFLSLVDTHDETHRDLLHHFYKKFGFCIKENDNIELEL